MLDIRIPIGLLFTLLGVLLTVYGLLTREDAALYVKSFQQNVNLWSGLLMLVFGAGMLWWARRGKKE
jgi:hypothetical protein